MAAPRLFLDSVPKAGAHLLERVLGELGYRRGQKPIGASAVLGRNRWIKAALRAPRSARDGVLVGVEVGVPVRLGWVRRRLDGVAPGSYVRGHVLYSAAFAEMLAERDFQLIHLVRDPRDVAVSHAHYVLDRPRHVFHRFYRSLGGWEEQLAFSIAGGWVPGVGYLASIGERYRLMAGWERYPNALTVRFEDLVGAAGGGDASVQRRTLNRLAAWLGRADEDLDAVSGRVFGASSTFRKGQIGSWRDVFARRHQEIFERVAGGLLESWQYG